VTRTILIVDDDPGIRRLIATTLEDVSGYSMTEAGDGEEAVERARDGRPEIVFLDIDMPRLNGIEACRRIRSEPTTADATIVMLTGDSDDDAERDARAAGADLFLTKPFSPLHLLRLVANDMQTEVPIRTILVVLATEFLRKIENDRARHHVVFVGNLHERLARFGLNIGGVDDSEMPGCEPFAQNEVQHLEGLFGGGLIILVVGNQAAADVGRQNFGRLEVLASERRLAATGGSD